MFKKTQANIKYIPVQWAQMSCLSTSVPEGGKAYIHQTFHSLCVFLRNFWAIGDGQIRREEQSYKMSLRFVMRQLIVLLRNSETSLSPEPADSTPHPHTSFCHINKLLSYHLGLQSVSLLMKLDLGWEIKQPVTTGCWWQPSHENLQLSILKGAKIFCPEQLQKCSVVTFFTLAN